MTLNNVRKNRNRSIRKFVRYVQYNSDKLKTFGILTFDRKKVGDYDRDDALRYWNTYASRVRKEFRDVAFIKVDDRKEPGSIQFYFLSTAELGSELFPIRNSKKVWNDFKGAYDNVLSYDLKYWEYGFSFALDLETDFSYIDEKFDIFTYIANFMAKDFKSDVKLNDKGELVIDRYHDKKYTVVNRKVLQRPKK